MSRAVTKFRSLSDAMCRAQRPLRILRALAWHRSVHDRFLARRGSELPAVEYRPLGFDPREKIRELRRLRAKARGNNPLEELLRGFCDQAVLVCRCRAG